MKLISLNGDEDKVKTFNQNLYCRLVFIILTGKSTLDTWNHIFHYENVNNTT